MIETRSNQVLVEGVNFTLDNNCFGVYYTSISGCRDVSKCAGSIYGTRKRDRGYYKLFKKLLK